MKLRVRTLRSAVAATAIGLGLHAHLQALIRDEDEFAYPILMLEGIAVLGLLAIALAVGFVVHLVRLVRLDFDDAAQLRRNDIPARCPLTLATSVRPVSQSCRPQD